MSWKVVKGGWNAMDIDSEFVVGCAKMEKCVLQNIHH